MHVSPTIRFDATTSEWVALSPQRSRRPHQVPRKASESRGSSRDTCPFCPGNEALTPKELCRVGGFPAWRVRVVPNLYPAFVSAEDQGAAVGSTGLFREQSASGAHEVVVESPDHVDDLRRLPEARVVDLLRALHARYRALSSATGTAAIVIFKNQGVRAGTSLSHPHWQIVATPVVPTLLERKLAVAEEYFRESTRCLYSDVLAAEERAQVRLVESSADYVAFVPFASPAPYQVRIQPRLPKASWDEVSLEELLPLATLLPKLLRRLDAELAEPDFNITIACAPPGRSTLRYFSWHLDVVPRTTVEGGFELGSGMKINTVLPEQAASNLRRRG